MARKHAKASSPPPATAKPSADVVTITNGPATYILEGLLPVDTHVFGSAARVYPPGLKWTREPYSSPLRLVRSGADTGPVTAEIIADAEAVAFSGGWKTASPASMRDAGETGLVRSIASDGSRAIVELDSGLQAYLPAESVVDPRGADGSQPATSAIAICESAVALFGPSYVAVMEDDGTHFVLFGHPSVPQGACAEV